MQLYNINNVKRFMNLLLKDNLFDSYEARGVVIRAFTGLEIDCVSDALSESEKTKYCSWSEIKPIVYDWVKGSKPPRFIKVGVCLTGAAAEQIDSNAAALHMTFTYENGAMSVLTGASQKKFALNKAVDAEWDGFTARMLTENGIELTEPSE